MVVIAQLVEQRIVIPPVASSNLVDHLSNFFGLAIQLIRHKDNGIA